MGSIIGEEFADFVAKQINLRQKIHGSGTSLSPGRSSEYLTYLNSKTSWVKLASGVRLDEGKAEHLGFSSRFAGSELAKNFK